MATKRIYLVEATQVHRERIGIEVVASSRSEALERVRSGTWNEYADSKGEPLAMYQIGMESLTGFHAIRVLRERDYDDDR